MLVDEYDKPILDVIDNPDMATANRDYLRGFYGIIKGSAQNVRFVLVTGVSMFSRVSLFSGLNNLRTTSVLTRNYATICGYTDRDLDTVFAPELPGLDRDEIREWYNGYHWLGDEKLYNPVRYAVTAARNPQFRSPHWFETGSPTFLFRMMMDREVSPMELENRVSDDAASCLDLRRRKHHHRCAAVPNGISYYHRVRAGWSHKLSTPSTTPTFEVRYSLNHGLLGFLGRQGKEVSDRRARNSGAC